MSLAMQPSTSSSTCLLNADDKIWFRYIWPLRLKKRLTASGEKTVLNVSPPFCTAYNGVQFIWLLRICDEYVLDMEQTDESKNRCQVSVTLYYKEGPAQDIQLTEAKFSVNDSEGRRKFSNVSLESLDYIKGSGWPHCSKNSAERIRFSSFVEENIGMNITVAVELKMKIHWFLPFGYLPDIDSRDNQLQVECENVLDEIINGQLTVPDIELFDVKNNRYAFHRHCFMFGCHEITKRCQRLSVNEEEVENVFANLYFNRVINEEAECFEDFVDLLVASCVVHFPALKRECERYICRELVLESTDDAFVKKMLLLAERFNLKVLKMVAFGVIVDRFISEDHTKRGSVNDIREELMQIAEQIKTTDEDNKNCERDCGKEDLVGSVIDQLEELAKHIRKVSMSPDSGCPGGIAPLCSSPDLQLLSQQGRRSSLKTSRELLTFSSSTALSPWVTSSARTENRHRRSVMFSFSTTLDESAMAQFKNNIIADVSSNSSNSLSSRILADVDERSSNASRNSVIENGDESEEERHLFEVEQSDSTIFVFEDSYDCCIPNERV